MTSCSQNFHSDIKIEPDFEFSESKFYDGCVIKDNNMLYLKNEVDSIILRFEDESLRSELEHEGAYRIWYGRQFETSPGTIYVLKTEKLKKGLICENLVSLK